MASPGHTLCIDHLRHRPPSTRRDDRTRYTFEWAQKSRIIRQNNPICELCGEAPSAVVHHIIPVSEGGSDDLDNLMAICHRCHQTIEPNRRLAIG